MICKYLIVLYMLVLLILVVPVSAVKAGDSIEPVENQIIETKSPSQIYHKEKCKEMHDIVLSYLRQSKPIKGLTDWEDRIEENTETTLNAVKADSYTRIYVEACSPNSIWIQRHLMYDIIRIESK